jgi:GNAT superfamily N-acetyltransferase
MALSRPWRSSGPGSAEGPYRPGVDEIGELNDVFADAFTDRYRRDGMAGVRVPFLSPRIWRYAIEDAAEGAMVWRDHGGRIVAFNMVHRSGTEGWMGPLAVRSDSQGQGRGKDMVTRGIAWLKQLGATIVGLETMPRTMDNIGFYSRLGFLPGQLTLTVSLNAAAGSDQLLSLERQTPAARGDLLGETRALLHGIAPGYDYTREIELTLELGLGDALLLRNGDRLTGYALLHSAPLVEGRASDELRVLKLVVDDERHFARMAGALADHARRAGAKRVAFRMQGEYPDAYQQIVALGGHVRWTDLRMALAGSQDHKPASGMVLSNWEI